MKPTAELFGAIRSVGAMTDRPWARAVLIYFDDDGQNIGQCLVRPDPQVSLPPSSLSSSCPEPQAPQPESAPGTSA